MDGTPRFSEGRRQFLHLGLGSVALLLATAAWWEAAILVGVILACVLYILPRLPGPAVYADPERRRRYLSGVAIHPFTVLLLIFLLPDRRDIVAASWGILAFGDGMATLVGRRVGSRRLPWNRAKSAAGTAAFVTFGAAAGVALCWWSRPVVMPPPYAWFPVAAPILAALAAAAVETIPIRLDDNFSTGAVAAAVLWWVSLVSEDAMASFARDALRLLPLALAVNGPASLAAWRAGTLTAPGALCAALTGITIVLAAGWGAWGVLAATFAMAVVTSRLGWSRKAGLGIAEERSGRRAAGNVFANTGVAAAAALLAALSYATEPALIGFAAALAAAGSDTMASEIGKAWGGRTRLFPSFRRVPPGTPGGITALGTLAGAAGAAILGASAAAAGLVPWVAMLPIVAGATAGAFTESALAAAFEPRGVLNNDVLNFLNTAAAAGVAVLIAKGM